MYVVQPKETPLFEQDEKAGCVGTGQYLIVGYSISSLDTEDASQAAKVEDIETWISP